MKVIITILFGVLSLFARDISKQTAPSELVVYNDGYSLFIEKRSFKSNGETQNLRYPDVASNIVTDSVAIEFDKKVKVLTQQYNYNTISLTNIANSYIGKKVRYKKENKLEKGILKAVSPIVIQNEKGIINLKSYSDIIFDNIPKSMSEKPYLEWKLESLSKEKVNTTVRYLVNSISWKSNYIFSIDGTKSSLDGWINIKNRSGKEYRDTLLKVVAGDVNMVSRGSNRYLMKSMNIATSYDEVKRKGMQGYHLYEIPFKVTLANKQDTQIHFLQESDPKYKKKLRFDLGSPSLYSKNKRRYKCKQSIEFKGLPQPIPAGTIRVYDSKENIFLGESRIDHKVKNERFSIDIGKDIDVILTAEAIKQKSIETLISKSVKYVLQNGSSSEKYIHVNIALGGWKAILSEDIKNISKGNIYLRIPIEIGFESKKEFTITFEKENKKNK